ncbi:MAG: hypothetical protein NTW87_21790 [Planctomycetota bacterium]|nr:hypothetical protein [Planctomycetota bacterium]
MRPRPCTSSRQLLLRSWRLLACCLLPTLLALTARAGEAPAAPLENLAPKARISANSEYSQDYLAKFVADGKIPDAGGHDDLRQAWCVKGETHKNGAELTFQWDAPVTIAHLVYFGRTAWFMEECWKTYEVFLDGATQPVAKGGLAMESGPQGITLPAPTKAGKLLIKFTSSYGGMNPGASEVQVFSAVPPPPQAPKPSVLKQQLLAGELGFNTLVAIQRRELNPTHVYTYHVEGFSPGGGLCLCTPDEKGGQLKELVASPQGQILDCDVSYDGKEILFSWKKTGNDPYRLYCINADGTGLKQITNDPWHDFNACWLPDGGIGFLSTRKPHFAYCWTSPVGTLYRMDRDGKNVRHLSANYLNDFTPAVMNDGKIMYSRWEYVDRPAIPIQSLWTINPDGTNLQGFYGNRVLSPATFMEPRPIPGTSAILCTLTAHNGPCRGAIGIINPAYGVNAQEAIRNLTPEVNIGKVDKGDGNFIKGPYENPCPVDEKYFLVSRRGTIMLRDYDGTDKCDLLAPKNGIGFYTPVPLRPRVRPPVRNSGLQEKGEEEWATVYLQDVYNGLEPQVKRGEVKQLCIVQEIEKSRLASLDQRAFGFQFPVVSCGATYAPKKVWGYVPVAEDGSAYFKVPTSMPIYFMALDAEGRAVQRMRSFTHLMPGEVQGCIGCHEPRNQTPRLNRVAGYLNGAEPKRPEPPEWGLAGFNYAQVVQPVLDKHCVQCHNAADPQKGVDLSGDLTDFFNVSYETLARENRRTSAKRYTSWICTENGSEANILIVAPKSWGSPASDLADIVLSGHPDKDGKARVAMDEKSRRRVLAWIDLNVPYYGTSLFTYGNHQGCRRMYPPDLDKTLQAVAKNRCAGCHDGGKKIPRRVWTRVTNPQLNYFLLAPLAKSAGGTEKCGKAIFESKDDPALASGPPSAACAPATASATRP